MSIAAKLLSGAAIVLFAAGFAANEGAAQTPKRGGAVTAGYEGGDPPNYDCHGSVTTAVIVFVAPQYSTLLRYDIAGYPKVEGDLAESWTVAPDGMTYTFKLRPNVKFHDGTPFTSADIKATYERLRAPPQGVVSLRKDDYVDLASIETPDPLTVVFKMTRANAAMLGNFANPFNCVYSARRLADNPAYPATNSMGTGPFEFVEHVRGQSWTSKRFEGYFRPGQPYIDTFKTVMLAPGTGPRAFAGGQIDMFLRTMTPQEMATIRENRRDAKFLQTPTLVDVIAIFNSQRKPFDDVRVRRALTLAIDRKGGLEPLTKITNLISAGGITRPGSDIALPEAELAKLPGYGPDIAAARAEARKLLAEAGQSNLKFTLLNRLTSPYQQEGIFVVDQWRQIGVSVEVRGLDSGPFLTAQIGRDFDVSLDVNGVTSEDPSLLLSKYVPGAGANFAGYTDATLTDLFNKQKVALNPAERLSLTNAFEKRVLDQAYVAPLNWAGWNSAVASYIHGWAQSPSYFVGYDMGNLWRE